MGTLLNILSSMRTALVTHTFLDYDQLGYWESLQRWYTFHIPLATMKGWDMITIDNGSSLYYLALLTNLGLRPISFSKQYRRDSLLGYPYGWRAMSFLPELFRLWEYDRIVFAEHDFYIVSKDMVDWIESVPAKQWATVFCKKYGFPESAFGVMTDPNLTLQDDWKQYIGKLMETTMPYTQVNRLLTGDRYEDSPPSGPVDFCAQYNYDTRLLVPTW